MRLLIVDDDPDVSGALAALAATQGFDVTCAGDGAEALKLVDSRPFPVVITDWVMPEIDGMDLIRQIRASTANGYTYIVMVTGSPERDGVRRGMEAGADDFLTKPFSAEDLRARLTVARRIMELQGDLAVANRTLRRSNQQLADFKIRTERELSEAWAVQRLLLPARMPDLAGWSFGWRMVPCEALAGDVVNIFELGDDRVGVYVLDVSGHGVGAALLSVQVSRMLNPEPGLSQVVRSVSDAGAIEHVRPLEVLSRLNRQFPMSAGMSRFFTLMYGVLDVESSVLELAGAGHPGPMLDRGRDRPEPLSVPGHPIGMFETGRWTERRIELRDTDRVVLFSDGVTEAESRGGEQFGDGRLVEAVTRLRGRSAQATADGVIDEVREFAGGDHLGDDLSVVVVDRCGEGG